MDGLGGSINLLIVSTFTSHNLQLSVSNLTSSCNETCKIMLTERSYCKSETLLVGSHRQICPCQTKMGYGVSRSTFE